GEAGLGLAVSRPGQRERERERERRVSDADASYNGPISDTRTLKHLIPQRKHAKNNSLSEATRSLSQGPRQTFTLSTTAADPKPDLMYARRTFISPGTEHYKQQTRSLSSPPFDKRSS